MTAAVQIGRKRKVESFSPWEKVARPALRATLSRRERDPSETGRHMRGRSGARVGIGYTLVTTS